MERRAAERVAANIDARFLCSNVFYSGTVLNLSEKGMFIRTRKYFPSNTGFMVVIRSDDDLLKVMVRVKRIIMGDANDDGMGVEIVQPDADYLEFVNRLKAAA